MKKVIKSYPLSTLCVVLIWVLSLAPFFPETPLDNVQFIDKYTHFIMYGGTCVVIWMEHLRHCRKVRQSFHYHPFALSVLLSLIALGGLMELLQAYATTTRSGEWLDFWADAMGAFLGTGIGVCLKKLVVRN